MAFQTSEPLRVALVAEGPTDKIIIQAAISQLLGNRRFVLRQLQPEESVAFGAKGTGGWGGVYYWCRQAVGRAGGALRDDLLFLSFDLLVLHLDGDVAGGRYSDAGITEETGDLPCVQPCPPASSTTDRLRAVLLRWAGETRIPPRTVLCTPSKSMEAWVLAALFPTDGAVVCGGLECLPDPEGRLGQQPKKIRVHKTVSDYRRRMADISKAWGNLRASLTEADRFSSEFLAAIP
ncbi:MAG: hypothetical protein HY748_17450 [Elusimicrobia bacterium]|nr:hypothetical protein [Elusimicrobiota bacterium]